MTFKQFEAIAKKYRPDVTVYGHGTFTANNDKNKSGIVFNAGTQKESRVYTYSGTYTEILSKLGIENIIQDMGEIVTIEKELETFRAKNGKPGLFAKKVMDYTKEIASLENKLAEIYGDKYIRAWEF